MDKTRHTQSGPYTWLKYQIGELSLIPDLRNPSPIHVKHADLYKRQRHQLLNNVNTRNLFLDVTAQMKKKKILSRDTTH